MIKLKNKIISDSEILCRNIFSQGLGLMFRFNRQSLIMIFKKARKINLHNFFVFYALEVILLDDDKKVIEINKQFKPFTFWSSSKECKYLIEIGKEESKNKIKVGDKIAFNN